MELITANSEVRLPKVRLAREIEEFLRSMDMPDEGTRGYLEVHMARMVRTLSVTPGPRLTGRILELGAYMHMTPALQCVMGYSEVRGAYYAKSPRNAWDRWWRRWENKPVRKQVQVGGQDVFSCLVDPFDAEKDVWPYYESHFDTVLACEIFEHFLHDPMHMLVEARRVLVNGGVLVLTTPNVASYTAVARVLEQSGNPQLYSQYPNPRGEFADSEVGHMREYTPQELEMALLSAGFVVDHIFTEIPPGYLAHTWVHDFLVQRGYPAHLRGEQLYAIARKDAALDVVRYPKFLYDGCE